MTELTLLQQARHFCDACDTMITEGVRVTSLHNAVDRILRHIEQREAAMRGPAQVPGEPKCEVCGLAEAYNVHGGSLSGHRFVPAAEVPGEPQPDQTVLMSKFVLRPGQTVHLPDRRSIANHGSVAIFLDVAEWTARADLPAPSVPTETSDAFSGWLDELQRLCDGATPGPWEVVDDEQVLGADSLPVADFHAGPATARNAAFVATARDALPKVIARVQTLEARLNEVGVLGTEFSDDPAHALQCIGELLDLAAHYDRHPNAPRDHG